MDSGQDDVSFLRALALHLRGSLSLPRLYLTGHSNGAMMANRMWCETGGSLFDNFVSFDGPPSSWFAKNSGTEHKSCKGASQFGLPPPYLSVFAYNDGVVGHTPEQHLDDEFWSVSWQTQMLSQYAFINGDLWNDMFAFEQLRAPLRCGESPPRTDAPSTETDRLRVFSACEGTAVVAAIKGENNDGTCPKISAGHCIPFLQKHLGCGLLEFAATWLTTGQVGCASSENGDSAATTKLINAPKEKDAKAKKAKKATSQFQESSSWKSKERAGKKCPAGTTCGCQGAGYSQCGDPVLDVWCC